MAALAAHNLARTGRPVGARHPGGSPGRDSSGALGQLGRVLVEWAAPAGADGAAALAALAAAAALAAGATSWIRRAAEGPAGGVGGGAPVLFAFVAAHAAFVVVAAPSAVTQPVDSRYLAPVYAPLALAAALTLDRFAARARERRAPLAWTAVFVVLTAAIAHTGLAGRAGLAATRAALESGYAGRSYNTPYWDGFSLFAYFRETPEAGPIFANSRTVFAAGFERIHTREGRYGGKDFTPRLPAGGADDLARWIDGAPEGAHVVWFRRAGQFRKAYLDYDAADLRCFRGLRPVEETPDGLILRVDKGYAPDCRPPSPPEGVAVVRAKFDVYRDGEFLVYSRAPCVREDTRARFFLHLYPVDAEDLPPRRRIYGYDNLDFRFGEHGMRLDGGCAARVPLPGWPAARAATGQIGGGGASWRVEYRFPPAARAGHAARNSLQRASR